MIKTYEPERPTLVRVVANKALHGNIRILADDTLALELRPDTPFKVTDAIAALDHLETVNSLDAAMATVRHVFERLKLRHLHEQKGLEEVAALLSAGNEHTI